jgi:hypothetical protein
MSWIEIESAAPVLNTPDFPSVFGGLYDGSIPLSALGHPEQFEFVALKSMKFKALETKWPHILQIYYPSYSKAPLYIDQRFCRNSSAPQESSPISLSRNSVLSHMEARLGTPYVWGGNWALGVPQMLTYYPPQKPLQPSMITLWTLQGLDCSGLLFEASGGITPRNTSHLIQYGRSLKPGESLEPLDMIIYPGHVLFVRDHLTIIESKFPFGVRICCLKSRIQELTKTYTFVLDWNPKIHTNKHFTIRRFLVDS